MRTLRHPTDITPEPIESQLATLCDSFVDSSGIERELLLGQIDRLLDEKNRLERLRMR